MWGLLPLSGVSYGKAKPVVHDLDSGDVDGESESQGCGWFFESWSLGGHVWCGGAYQTRHKRCLEKRMA